MRYGWNRCNSHWRLSASLALAKRRTSGQTAANTGPGFWQLCSQAGQASPTASDVTPGTDDHGTGTQRLFSRTIGVPATGPVEGRGGRPAQPASTHASINAQSIRPPWRRKARWQTPPEEAGKHGMKNRLINNTNLSTKNQTVHTFPSRSGAFPLLANRQNAFFYNPPATVLAAGIGQKPEHAWLACKPLCTPPVIRGKDTPIWLQWPVGAPW